MKAAYFTYSIERVSIYIVIFIIVFSISNSSELLGQSTDIQKPDSVQAVETLTQFREAIISGDRLAAGEMLTQEAIIMQAGEQCDRETFINKHIIPECKYVYAVNQSVAHRVLRHRTDLIWISTNYNVDVKHEGDETVYRKLAELAILKRDDGEWKIDMIHWSNCPRYPDSE